MVSKNLIKKYKLDQEEIDLLKEEEKYVTETENEKFFNDAVDKLKNRTKLFSIRYNINTIDKLKQKANEAGMNYQTLINVILKQYVDGKINITL